LAGSNAHKWGQAIGELFELSVNDLLTSIALDHGLYLDKAGFRAARNGKLVRWEDLNGNHHNLDYVMERGGSENEIGTPVAFIEIAWRRYTKHSKNKAQEIEGALIPLRQTYKTSRPLLGAILAGEFTQPSLAQLRSQGFQVLYIPYRTILEAFATAGIDASSTEMTTEHEFGIKIQQWENLSSTQIDRIKSGLIQSHDEQVLAFIEALDVVLRRKVVAVSVTPLFGEIVSWSSIVDAIAYIRDHEPYAPAGQPFVRFEITVRYSNGDNILGSFQTKCDSIEFLESFVR